MRVVSVLLFFVYLVIGDIANIQACGLCSKWFPKNKNNIGVNSENGEIGFKIGYTNQNSNRFLLFYNNDINNINTLQNQPEKKKFLENVVINTENTDLTSKKNIENVILNREIEKENINEEKKVDKNIVKIEINPKNDKDNIFENSGGKEISLIKINESERLVKLENLKAPDKNGAIINNNTNKILEKIKIVEKNLEVKGEKLMNKNPNPQKKNEEDFSVLEDIDVKNCKKRYLRNNIDRWGKYKEQDLKKNDKNLSIYTKKRRDSFNILDVYHKKLQNVLKVQEIKKNSEVSNVNENLIPEKEEEFFDNKKNFDNERNKIGQNLEVKKEDNNIIKGDIDKNIIPNKKKVENIANKEKINNKNNDDFIEEKQKEKNNNIIENNIEGSFVLNKNASRNTKIRKIEYFDPKIDKTLTNLNLEEVLLERNFIAYAKDSNETFNGKYTVSKSEEELKITFYFDKQGMYNLFLYYNLISNENNKGGNQVDFKQGKSMLFLENESSKQLVASCTFELEELRKKKLSFIFLFLKMNRMGSFIKKDNMTLVGSNKNNDPWSIDLSSYV